MATELGQAYVQIMPSAKGISGKITKAIDPEAASAGKLAGGKLVSGIKKVIATAGIGVALKKAITEGGNLEQSIGGIETLFKDHASTVRKYANEAYKTVGVSANEYMENVTSFSASLLQSMGGDTKEAAKVAHTAMVDMGDNANKMGTDMRDIQNAYQGFAKQNYTMLDNLKLGYGGTKSEMERLLKDAQELTGVKYDINNLDDVFMAVHAIQQEIGITGTTALEAEETIQGSFNAMKAAFTNVLGALAIGENLKGSLQALTTTISTFLFDNLIPMIGNIISQLPTAISIFIQEFAPAFIENGGELIITLADGIITGIPTFFEIMAQFMGQVVVWIQEQLPGILKEGVAFISEFASGIFKGLPDVLDSIGEILDGILTAIFKAAPMILVSGIELISSLAKGIWNNLPQIISTMGNLLIRLIGTIRQRLPEFLQQGIQLIGRLALGIVKAIPGIVAKIPQVISALVRTFSSLIGQFVGIGADIVKGLWKGIGSVKNWILSKIKGFVGDITKGIKGFFGIKSPSKVMADEVGKWLPVGLAEGIEDNIKPVSKAMDKLGELTTGTLESQIRVSSLGAMNVQGLSNSNGITQHITINSPTELSPSETARQVKNASRNLAMEW